MYAPIDVKLMKLPPKAINTRDNIMHEKSWKSSSNSFFFSGLSCFDCGIMYDGTAFMGLRGVAQCQFLESDAAAGKTEFSKECPADDACCFSLREHMNIDFWGRKDTFFCS